MGRRPLPDFAPAACEGGELNSHRRQAFYTYDNQGTFTYLKFYEKYVNSNKKTRLEQPA